MKFIPKKLITEDELTPPTFDQNRTYDANNIIELIERSFVLEDQNKEAFLNIARELDIDSENPEIILDDICQDVFLPTWSLDDEMEAEELSNKLTRFAKYMKFNQEELNALAEEIGHTKNPTNERIQEFKDEIESDISSLENIKLELRTNPAIVELGKLIKRLKEFEYSGNKNETWDYNVYEKDKQKYTLLGGSEED